MVTLSMLRAWRLQRKLIYFGWIKMSNLWTCRLPVHCHYIKSANVRNCKVIYRLVSSSLQCNNGSLTACELLSIKHRHWHASLVWWKRATHFWYFAKGIFLPKQHTEKTHCDYFWLQKGISKCDAFEKLYGMKQVLNVCFLGSVLTGGVHVMSAGLGLCLRLGLSHNGGTEWVHHSRLAGPSGGLRNVSRRPWGGAWAAWVKGRRAAMETSPAVSTAPNTAVAQVHRQSLLWKEG